MGRSGAGRALADALLALLFAPLCAACREPLDHPTQGAVCNRCWLSILPLTPPLCDVCGDPLPSRRGLSLPLARCPRCRRHPHAIDRSRAIGPYDGTLRNVIHALKYDARRSLARPLGRLMSERGAEVLAGASALVPVPLHPSRRRERGFNQAADLARQVGRQALLPVIPTLRRVRATVPQAALPAGRRHENVRDAFGATGFGHTATGLVIVLVDDVSTTGATLEACARALKAAGVAEVRALTAARVVTSPR